MNVIEVTNLTKRYGDQTVVDGVSFAVEEGEIFGILGPNGAGKTTTVESISGLRTPDSGTISVLGLDPRRTRRAASRLGVQLQESELPEQLKVWEALDLYTPFYTARDWEQLIENFGLAGEARQPFPQALRRAETTPLNRAGAGRRPEDRGARRLHYRPRSAGTARYLAAHRGYSRPGVTMLLVTHFMEEAERLCDRLALIDPGRVIALDTPAGIVSLVDAEQRMLFRPSRRWTTGYLPACLERARSHETAQRLPWRAPASSSTRSLRAVPIRSWPTTPDRTGRTGPRLYRAYRPQARRMDPEREPS